MIVRWDTEKPAEFAAQSSTNKRERENKKGRNKGKVVIKNFEVKQT